MNNENNNIEYYQLEDVHSKATQRNKKPGVVARLIYWKDEFVRKVKINYNYYIRKYGKKKNELEYPQKMYGSGNVGDITGNEQNLYESDDGIEELPIIGEAEDKQNPDIDLHNEENPIQINNDFTIDEKSSNKDFIPPSTPNNGVNTTNSIDMSSITQQMDVIRNSVINNLNTVFQTGMTEIQNILSTLISENERCNTIIKDQNLRINTMTKQYEEQKNIAQNLVDQNKELTEENASWKKQLLQTQQIYQELQEKAAPLIKTLTQRLDFPSNSKEEGASTYSKSA